MFSLPRWRNPLRKPVAPSRVDPYVTDARIPDMIFNRLPNPADRDALERLLAEVEATALQIYTDHGLPTVRGHYARSPRAKLWKFIADDLTPEERFALVQANPPERGWRFGLLPDLGRLSTEADLQAAGTLLRHAEDIRQMRTRPVHPDDLAHAIQLGLAWKTLQASQLKLSSTLELKPPTRRKPDRRSKKAYKQASPRDPELL